ncbi:MAG: Rieske 2Fe-2S domain-containing protein [Herpetosiphon sp.]
MTTEVQPDSARSHEHGSGLAHDANAAPTQSEQHEINSPARRKFLSQLSIGLGGLTGALMGLPVVGFLIAPLLKRPPQQWQPVGKINDFEVGKTVEVTFADPSPLPWAGVVAQTAAWLRREKGDAFQAYAVNCTHLGCPVRWLQDASLFMCPCHGGVYYQDGRVAAGPPPQPLPQYEVRVRDGNVEILTSPLPIGSPKA